MNRSAHLLLLFLIVQFSIAASISVDAQTTSFSYQGTLSESALPANGDYDFEFELFDSLAGGNAVGSPLLIPAVQVTDGAFTVTLDFGNQFPGAGRWIEIRMRQSVPGAKADELGGFTTLTPRQEVLSVPYAVRSASSASADSAATANNSDQLGGVAAAQYVVTTDPRLSDARTPTPGSGDYIQNGTTQQPSSAFNISGTGTSSIFNVSDRYDLGSTRVLGTSNTSNLFVGIESGLAGPSSGSNTLIGYRAGAKLEGASNNTFVGANAGENSVGFANNAANLGFPAGRNTFIGSLAGNMNINGMENTYVGTWAGRSNDQSGNTFIGMSAGEFATGGNNLFVGKESGSGHDGTSNTFIGSFSGQGINTGTFLTLLGLASRVGAEDLINSSAIGNHAQVDQSNSLVLGSIAGVNNATANTRVGIGTTTPERTLHVKGPGAQEIMVESSDASGRKWTIQASGDPGSGRFEIVDRTSVTSRLAILNNGRVGIGETAPQNRLQVNGAIQVTGARGTVTGNAVTISSESDHDLIQSWSSRPVVLNGLGNFVGINNTSPQDQLDVTGRIRFSSLGSGGATALCQNASNQIATCSSSLRYKSNVESFFGRSDILSRLRPVTFQWKESGVFDLGLVAEEVAEIEPLLVTYNENGAVEGVKYDRIGVVLLNVVKTQRQEIEDNRGRIKQLEEENRELHERYGKVIEAVCSVAPDAEVCLQDN